MMKITRKDEDFWNTQLCSIKLGDHFSVKSYPERIFISPISEVEDYKYSTGSSEEEKDDLEEILFSPTMFFAIDIASGEFLFWDAMQSRNELVHIYTEEELQLIINTSKKGE